MYLEDCSARAARHGKLLGVSGPFLYKIADTVFNECKSGYPELSEHADYIKKIIKIEEERFAETIDQGLAILSGYMDEMKKSGKTVLSGEDAFRLYDTYGFPLDLTVDTRARTALALTERDLTSACRTRGRRRSPRVLKRRQCVELGRFDSGRCNPRIFGL